MLNYIHVVLYHLYQHTCIHKQIQILYYFIHYIFLLINHILSNLFNFTNYIHSSHYLM